MRLYSKTTIGVVFPLIGVSHLPASFAHAHTFVLSSVWLQSVSSLDCGLMHLKIHLVAKKTGEKGIFPFSTAYLHPVHHETACSFVLTQDFEQHLKVEGSHLRSEQGRDYTSCTEMHHVQPNAAGLNY